MTQSAPNGQSLPTGTVTFLFTDIEGSTRLWQQHPAAMPAALARHHAILHEAIAANQGYVFQIIGDAFSAAFHAASQAVAAAVAAQRALCNEAWGDTPIKVRMGIHTGAAEAHVQEERAGGYSGYMTLSRTQRVMSAAHGGQALLTQATYELAHDRLPEYVTLRDMGERRLKDLIQPEHLYQLAAPDLPHDFPPLKTLDARANNLPAQLTSFIGREKELAEVKRLLTMVRLVTLAGTGGAGKTRLSLQVAADLIDDFDDGVWFVKLEELTDPGLVPQAVMSVLGLREETDRPLLTTLIDFLRAKRLLLILDNSEHLIEACAQLTASLLKACPQVRLLASSREVLGVPGETIFHVPSLGLPDPQRMPSLADLAQVEAIRLFIERATTAQSRFALTTSNAAAVAQICRRLDGIPLAIELAAARVKVLSVEQIAARLDDRFRLLTGGSRTALPRQQTLRALIDWSYGLLSDSERIVFWRLAAFVRGWTLEAAEAMCSGDVIEVYDVLDLLTRLVDKSLILKEEIGGEARYHRLETIREYALEKLRESGEEPAIRSKHFDFFVILAEEAEPHLTGARQGEWLDRLETEHDNLRAALQWSLTTQPASALQLAGALGRFWDVRAYFTEGRSWLDQALAKSVDASPIVRARGLRWAGLLAARQGDHAHAQKLIGESVEVSRAYGDQRGLVTALNYMGYTAFSQGEFDRAKEALQESAALSRSLNDEASLAVALLHSGSVAWLQGDVSTARQRFEESLAIRRALGDTLGIGKALYSLGGVAESQGDYADARRYLEESLAITRQIGDKKLLAYTLAGLGEVASAQGDLEAAHRYHTEGLAVARELSDKVGIAYALEGLGGDAYAQADYAVARGCFEDSLNIRREIGDKDGILTCLENLARVTTAQGHTLEAIRLFAAVTAVRTRIGATMMAGDQAEFDRAVASARAQISEAAFDAAWNAGQVMTLDDAIRYAVSQPAG
jgi:predicted ATPase/class 3 adenylate cyclase